MRNETVNLDLAALTSRVHTLLYSTLPATGKTLDSIVDTSPTPISDRYLDLQDDLEARIKDGTAGLTDFCSHLGKQWKEADEIWSTAVDEGLIAKALQRDIVEAALKTPAAPEAIIFEARLAATMSKCAMVAQVLAKLSRPRHAQWLLDQDEHTQALSLQLTEDIDSLKTKQAAAKDAAVTYRAAVTALTNSQTLVADLVAAREDIGALLAAAPRIQIDSACLQMPVGQAVDAQQYTSLASSVEATDRGPLQRAPTYMQALQRCGIDPNIRRDLQDNVLATAELVQSAKSFLHEQETARQLYDEALWIAASLRAERSRMQARLERLDAQICSSAWSDESPKECVSSSEERLLLSDLDLDARVGALNNCGSDALLPDASQYLQQEMLDLASLRNQVTVQTAILERVERQTSIVASIDAQYAELSQELEDFHEQLRRISVIDMSVLADATAKLNKLDVRRGHFADHLAANVPFVCSTDQHQQIDLQSVDARVRTHVNSLVIRANGGLQQAETTLQFAEAARSEKTLLDDVASQRIVWQQQTEDLKDLATKTPAERHVALQKPRLELERLEKQVRSMQVSAHPGFSINLATDLEVMRCSELAKLRIALEEVRNRANETSAEIAATEAQAAERLRQEQLARLTAEKRASLRVQLLDAERKVSSQTAQANTAQSILSALLTAVAKIEWTGHVGGQQIQR